MGAEFERLPHREGEPMTSSPDVWACLARADRLTHDVPEHADAHRRLDVQVRDGHRRLYAALCDTGEFARLAAMLEDLRRQQAALLFPPPSWFRATTSTRPTTRHPRSGPVF